MSTGMLWPIKASLTAYIESLDDGKIEVRPPAARQGHGFWFPLAEPAAGERGFLQFSGAVRLTGHWGMLDVEFRDPRVEFDDDGGAVLLVRERSVPEQFLPVARLAEAGAGASGQEMQMPAALTGEGAFLLGGQYPPGTSLSPVRLELPGHAL